MFLCRIGRAAQRKQRKEPDLMDAAKALEEADRCVRSAASRLEPAGVSFTIDVPGLQPVGIGPHPQRARVAFRSPESALLLRRLDVLRLAEAYLSGEIEVDGDLTQVVRLHAYLGGKPTWRDRLGFALRLLLRDRPTYNRESIAFHYDRPPEFFLPWFERWRSYSHGFYASPEEAPEEAQARKLARAVDALGLAPGSEVLDVGCGWGSFVEYAGLRGIRVHAITISREQHRFVEDLIQARRLPCRVELVDFVQLRPDRRFQGAVMMGSMEHLPDYAQVARRLDELLEPGAAVWADFSAREDSRATWGFVKRYIFSGTTAFVDVPRLSGALRRQGFRIVELEEDTLHYAWTVRDWARAFDHSMKQVAEVGGEASTRAFRLWLWASYVSFLDRRTQAYHLVASRRGAAPPPATSGAR